MLFPSVCLIFEAKDSPCSENVLFYTLYIVLTELTCYKHHINFLCAGLNIFKRLWNKVVGDDYDYYLKLEKFLNSPEKNR